MLERIVEMSLKFRVTMLVLLGVLLSLGVYAASHLPIDALPDASNLQVSVLTTAPGLSPVEVERTITVPLENALNGVPNMTELRSLSRAGLSAITVIFKDGTDIWLARQLITERVTSVSRELPPSAELPELAPVSTGLGEIYQFVVRSEQHTPMQLRTLLDWEIVPKLREVPGVIEVNTQGGNLKQFHVVIDRSRLAARKSSLREVVEALESANVNVGGGYIERSSESYSIRGQGMLRNEEEVGQVVLRRNTDGTPLLVRDVAEVKIGSALRYGVISFQGEEEAVTGTVMMLLGSNSRDVVRAVAERMEDIRKELPLGVSVEVVYDRSDFVGRTLSTVMKNLLEGVLIVTIVLTLLLGSWRGALSVILGIPAAMAVAVMGMLFFGITGDLMSLGAIDFGFLVDGPIVLLEAVIAGAAGKRLTGNARAREYAKLAGPVARPVAFAVAIILLVYVPLLTLEGVEGKMFRPMALTMACALFGALIYALVFFPAVLTTLVPPPTGHGPHWLDKLTHAYGRILPWAIAQRWKLVVATTVLLVGAGWLLSQRGADFLPRIFEGDAMVTIRRAPSISLDEALRLDLATEKILRKFPEVVSALAMTGRAEVATDPNGNDSTDILVHLKPQEDWITADDFDSLSEAFKASIEAEIPGTFVSVSQPIEDLTNQLISGSKSDVAVDVDGTSLEQLSELSDAIGQRLKKIPGTGDLRIERLLGQPTITATANRQRMARYGVRVEDAFLGLSAAREGVEVGTIYEDARRFDLRVLAPPDAPTAAALGELLIETTGGRSVPLKEVVDISETDGPIAVRRQARERTVRIDVNLRGRDLVSWVTEAKKVVADEFNLPPGYAVRWGGQFENFDRASDRLKIVLPAVAAIILAMLWLMFRNGRFAFAVFITVPFAFAGGILGLLVRGMNFSLPAAVGFIALGGISVLNGVVIANEVRRRLEEGEPLYQAIMDAATTAFRAVLCTAAVAALGFLPMAYASSAGSEVQRPLATVVMVGILVGTAVTLLVFPGLLVSLLGTKPRAVAAPMPRSPDELGVA